MLASGYNHVSFKAGCVQVHVINYFFHSARFLKGGSGLLVDFHSPIASIVQGIVALAHLLMEEWKAKKFRLISALQGWGNMSLEVLR